MKLHNCTKLISDFVIWRSSVGICIFKYMPQMILMFYILKNMALTDGWMKNS